jgi:hypothetical protein
VRKKKDKAADGEFALSGSRRIHGSIARTLGSPLSPASTRPVTFSTTRSIPASSCRSRAAPIARQSVSWPPRAWSRADPRPAHGSARAVVGTCWIPRFWPGSSSPNPARPSQGALRTAHDRRASRRVHGGRAARRCPTGTHAQGADPDGARDPGHGGGQAADRDFHNAVLEATGNAPLFALSSSIGAAVRWTTIFKQRKRELPRDPMPEHWKVFDAIAAARPDQARQAMERLVGLALEDTPRRSMR